MQNHEAWLAIAQDDLKAAKGLLKLELFSAVAYHSQQAAEKSLKASILFWKYGTVPDACIRVFKVDTYKE